MSNHEITKTIFILKTSRYVFKECHGMPFFEEDERHFFLDNELTFEAKADSGPAQKIKKK